MTTSAVEMRSSIALDVRITEENLIVDLDDGRTISVPLAWYPRLLHASHKECNNWRFIGRGEGIHWIDLDEDISIENTLLGKASGESQQSLKQWMREKEAHAAGDVS